MMDYDQLAHEYARHRQIQPEVFNNLLKVSGVGSSSRVLEVGCGTGNYIVTLQQTSGCNAWGIDPSNQMLKKAHQPSSPVQFKVGRGEQIEIESDFFDLLFSVDVIHHITDRERYYLEAYRVLHPGGMMCTVTDSEHIIRQRQPLAVYFPETIDVELKRYPPIQDLENLMRTCGFSDIHADQVEFPYPITDIQAFQDKAFSSLHLIPDEAHQRGLQHMRQDLQKDPIQGISRYICLWGTK